MRRLLALLVPVYLAAGLAACSPAAAGSGPSPVTELPAPAAASPSAAASDGGPPSPSPTLPPEAAVQDRAGATAFIGHWFDLLNAAYASGDPTALEQASTAECAFCDSMIEQVRNEAAAGESREGGDVRVVELAVAPGEVQDTAYLANAIIEQDQGRVLGRDGEPVAQVERIDTGVVTALVVWAGGSWRLDALALTVEP